MRISDTEIYTKAYAYYTWSRAQNGRPPMVDKARYQEMVPIAEATQIAGYYDQGVANGTIPVEEKGAVEIERGAIDSGTNQGEGTPSPNGDTGTGSKRTGKRSKQSKR